MESLRELILGPADIDRLSIKCESCGTELVLSLSALSAVKSVTDGSSEKPLEIPTKCPSCPDNWSKIHGAVLDFAVRLEELKKYGVSFRVAVPESPKAAGNKGE